ncbi:MAG: hypothetical protein JW838_00160 [Spirochaetes bacterium]|nr:hypothetical protein [Spirochaetota bacterium]
MARDTKRDVGRIDAMIHLIQDAIDHVRGIARGLRPVASGPDGFIISIESHVAEMQRLLGVKIRFRKQGRVLIGDDFAAAHLYQIVKELLNNAVKYGDGSGISLQMRDTGRGIRITMKNGVGKKEGRKKASGIGLNIIRHRADLIGAKLTVSQLKDVFCVELELQ